MRPVDRMRDDQGAAALTGPALIFLGLAPRAAEPALSHSRQERA